MTKRPNILFVLADQVRAASLPLYGETQIETPHIDRLAREGCTMQHMIASAPVCTPYRAMMLTGRHPQTTGHVINFVRTRHDEIGWGDVFSHAGYHTGWIGKWHLHTGSFPQINGADFVPEGRDRLGFEHWRGYNFHMDYFQGTVNRGDWDNEHWPGYETDGLAAYADEFLDNRDERPFCLFLSPHQAHDTPGEYAPAAYYDRLPADLKLPPNVPADMLAESLEAYRHYLAMILTLDDMLGEVLQQLESRGLLDDTLVIFTADHGSQMGAQGYPPWDKSLPYEDSLHVPWIMRYPAWFAPGSQNNVLTSPVDLMPTFCGLLDIPCPGTVEGVDLSAAWMGQADAPEQDAVLTMNFSATFDYCLDGQEWRGLRSKTHSYARWLNGSTVLYDLVADPTQQHNLADQPDAQALRQQLEERLQGLLAERQDDFGPCEASYHGWFDAQRRVVRNAYGDLSNPEQAPDWSLLG